MSCGQGRRAAGRTVMVVRACHPVARAQGRPRRIVVTARGNVVLPVGRAHEAVAGERFVERSLHLLQVADADPEVEDGFGRHAGDRRAADVSDVERERLKRRRAWFHIAWGVAWSARPRLSDRVARSPCPAAGVKVRPTRFKQTQFKQTRDPSVMGFPSFPEIRPPGLLGKACLPYVLCASPVHVRAETPCPARISPFWELSQVSPSISDFPSVVCAPPHPASRQG
ncbi:hypothetical protein GCM10010341_65680 [Streptomyces noursei]|nr:hypothetical protein GCM10010341_65680 [Streptomyces noursei]